MERELLLRLAGRHGSLATQVLAGATDSSRHFGAHLYAFEVDYFVRREWAQSAEDVLWRRTKSGLHLDRAAAKAVSDYLRGTD
jgi:glycerol-3-phosphate dehydrogenase